MTLVVWGRKLAIWGLGGAALFGAPLVVLLALPGLDPGFLGLVALLLGFSMVPLCLVAAACGLLLILVGLLRR